MKVIARVKSEFPTKFGIPRQSGLVSGLKSQIIFEPAYRNPDALRGLEDYSHIWLLWEFSESIREEWSPTVRPPRLGGNQRVGVFATRSPFRPNPIGLSCVQLQKIEWQTPQGPVLWIAGADLMDQTPIYDIKPYLPFTDSRPGASSGFAGAVMDQQLQVQCPEEEYQKIPEAKREAVFEILAQDPRPSYQKDPERVYGFTYANMEFRFTVDQGVLTIQSIAEGGGRKQI